MSKRLTTFDKATQLMIILYYNMHGMHVKMGFRRSVLAHDNFEVIIRCRVLNTPSNKWYIGLMAFQGSLVTPLIQCHNDVNTI